MKVKELLKSVPFRNIIVKNIDGVKKPFGEKSNMTVEEINSTTPLSETEATHHSFYLKHNTDNLYCIDVDEKINPEWLKDCFYTVSTSGNGYHYYVKIPDMVEYKNEIDVFNEFKGDLIKHKRNVWETIDSVVHGTELMEFKYIDIKKYINETKLNISKSEINTPTKKTSFTQLKNIINKIDIIYSNNYDTWSKIVFCIFNVATENKFKLVKIRELIHMFSEKGDNYEEMKVETFISNMKYTDGALNIGTLKMYLTKTNLDNIPSYSNYKNKFEKNKFKLLHPSVFVSVEDGEHYLMKKKDLIHSYGTTKIKTNSDEVRRFTDIWLMDENVRTYRIMDFYPNKSECPDDVYNLFSGFSYNRTKGTNIDLTPVFDHIKTLTGNETESYDYFIKWLAQLIQQPEIKEGISIVFKSQQGTGKNLFLDWFGSIIGNKYYLSTANSDDIFGRFTSAISNKLLINLDETDGFTTFSNSNKLKNIITQPTVRVERKGIDTQHIKDYSRYIFTTNNETPVKIEMSDRRFVCFECDNKWVGDEPFKKQHFKELHDFMYTEGVQQQFFNYLMSIDLTNINLRSCRPITSFYRDLQEVNIPKIALFLIDEVITNNCNVYTGNDMFGKFREWLNTNNFKSDNTTSTKFGLSLKKYNGVVKQRNKKGIIYKVDIDTLQNYLVENNYLKVENNTDII